MKGRIHVTAPDLYGVTECGIIVVLKALLLVELPIHWGLGNGIDGCREVVPFRQRLAESVVPDMTDDGDLAGRNVRVTEKDALSWCDCFEAYVC